MDIDQIIQAIDDEIATRPSRNFGIKVGNELFKALAAQGHVENAVFSVMGSGLFEMELPTYKGKHALTLDWEMEDYAFLVGHPKS